jgi:hypothetical protein
MTFDESACFIRKRMSPHVSQGKEVDYVDIEMIKGTNKHIEPEVIALKTI